MTNDEFINYCNNSNINKIKKGLQDPNVDPSYKNNLGIRVAALHGNIKIIELLINDDRVDVSALNYTVLLRSLQHKYDDVIELLLNKKEVINFLLTKSDFKMLKISLPYLKEKLKLSSEEILNMWKTL